ncbi:MAG: SPFH domain-containing protein [Rikenellaceae bacterium]|nr:SPFH domain-containing protein [Rikenellaceae bacterium]
MTTENYTYSGWKMNGFAALFMILMIFAVAIASIVASVNFFASGSAGEVIAAIAGVLLIITSIIMLIGFMMLEPNEARVLLFFGKYRGTFYETGFWWVNPFMSKKSISMRARNLNVDPIKVNDKAGNPILIGLVLVWRIKREGIYKAVFEIDAPTGAGVQSSARMNVLENFVAVQSDAALRHVAGLYAYDENTTANEEITLRSGGEEINDQLTEQLTERLAMAGIEVVEARLNYLAYAPEIAAVMLRRQQADAIIAAREKIVEGAVSMVKMALDRLDDENVVELDEERKAAMVSNLLVVLCSDESAQPVLNAGTLNH